MIADLLIKVDFFPKRIFQQLFFNGKDKDCLDNALNDISKAISGFYLKSTKWNKTIGVN